MSPVAGHGTALDGGTGQLVEAEPVAQDLQQPQLFLFYVHQDRVQAMKEKKAPPAGAKVIYFTADQQKNGGESGASAN